MKAQIEKKIIYILPKVDFFQCGWRGRVSHALGVANGLSRNNAKVTVVSGKGLTDFKSNLDNAVNLYVVIPYSWKKYKPTFMYWQYSIIKKLKLLIPKLKSDFLIMRYAVGNVLLNIIIPKLTRDNTINVLEINSLAYHQYGQIPKYIRYLIMKLELLIISNFRTVYAVSEQIKRDMELFGYKGKVIVVPNAAEIIKINSLSHSDDNILTRLVYFGRFQPYYDFKKLIDVFKILSSKYNQLQIHFWGDGKQLLRMKNYANYFEDVYFHGEYQRHELSNILCRESDILILPLKVDSMGTIGSPTKLFEYMACGLPIVAPSLGQIKSIITDNVNGLLYNPHDNKSFCDVIEKLILNKSIQNRLGAQAQKDFMTNHTWGERMKYLIQALDT